MATALLFALCRITIPLVEDLFIMWVTEPVPVTPHIPLLQEFEGCCEVRINKLTF